MNAKSEVVFIEFMVWGSICSMAQSIWMLKQACHMAFLA